jgi:hypothetical protein
MKILSLILFTIAIVSLNVQASSYTPEQLQSAKKTYPKRPPHGDDGSGGGQGGNGGK